MSKLKRRDLLKGAALAGAVQAPGKRMTVHTEPFAAFAQVRAWAYGAGQPDLPLGQLPALLLPGAQNFGGINEENVPVSLVRVRALFTPVEMRPPEGLTLPAVIAHRRSQHGNGFSVSVKDQTELHHRSDLPRNKFDPTESKFFTLGLFT